MKAWHFVKPDKRLRFDPFTEINVGETIKVDPEKLSICSYGLHASKRAIDALSFVDWEDAWICRVTLGGKMLEEADKFCASERTVLWMAPADDILRVFACEAALFCLPLWDAEYPEDKRPLQAIDAKLGWCDGIVTENDLASASASAIIKTSTVVMVKKAVKVFI